MLKNYSGDKRNEIKPMYCRLGLKKQQCIELAQSLWQLTDERSLKHLLQQRWRYRVLHNNNDKVNNNNNNNTFE